MRLPSCARRGFCGVFRRHTVRVFGGVESAFRVRHFTANVLQRVLRHLGVKRVICCLGGFEIRQRELGLVVQHLLEVRHAPVGIDRVAVKASTNVVAHATDSHRLKRFQHHMLRAVVARPGMFTKQKVQLRGPRKLWRVAKPPASLIKRAGKLPDRM